MTTYLRSIEPPLPEDIHTILPGDAHLGAPNRSGALLEVLRSLPEHCKIIILGDFFDSHHMHRLKKTDLEVIEHLKEKEVEYILGNHDRFIEAANINASLKEITKNWNIHNSHLTLKIEDTKYYFEHGDRFDSWSTKFKFISVVGSRLYTLFKIVDGEKQRMASTVKRKSKKWLKTSQKVMYGMVSTAKEHEAHFAIAGHTHLPIETTLNNVRYLNVGSFDSHQSSFVSINTKGRPTLHYASTWKRPRTKRSSL